MPNRIDELNVALRRFKQESTRYELTTPRYRMRYDVWGSGPPLVIVHGLNDVVRSFIPLMSHLADSFQCIAVHLADGEQDNAILRRYRHEDYTSDLIALFDHLKLDQVDLVGSSFGTTISLRTAATHPERIRRVVLQGAFAYRRLLPPEVFLTYLGQSWPWRMGALPLRPRIMRHLEKKAFVAAPEMIHFLLENSAYSPIKAVIHRARQLETLDLRPMLPQVSHPVLMIGGDCDRIVPRTCEAELEAKLPQVRRVEFAPCGHYPQYTFPNEMAAAIREHLT